MVAGMDAGTLKLIFRALIYLGSLYQPAVALYHKVDGYTFGCARYILLAIVAVVLFWVSSIVWFVLRFVFANLYRVFIFAQRSFSGASAATGAGSDAAATVFEAAGSAAAAATVAGGSLAGKVAAGATTAAVTAAGLAGAAAAGAAVTKGAPAAATEDSKYDF